MRTRRLTLNPDHVGALNLVEIEFHGEEDVITAWRNYFTQLSSKVPDDQQEQEAFFRKRDGLLAKLLHSLAKALKFEIEQLDIFEGGYSPQGWVDDEIQMRALRHLMINVFRGNGSVPVTILNAPVGSSPYPPPPVIEQGRA